MELIDYRILVCVIYAIGCIVGVLMSFSYCNKLKKAGYNIEFQIIPIMFIFSWLWVILLVINWNSNELKTKNNGKL